jgi:hypothetical protein
MILGKVSAMFRVGHGYDRGSTSTLFTIISKGGGTEALYEGAKECSVRALNAMKS